MGFDLTDASRTVIKKWVIVVAGFYFCALLGLAIMTIRHLPAGGVEAEGASMRHRRGDLWLDPSLLRSSGAALPTMRPAASREFGAP